MLPILLALGMAVLYGVGDFFTGLASRRSPMLFVMVMSQATGLAVTLGAAFAMGGWPSREDYIWGGWAGIALLIAVALLVVAFRDGRMSEVAPVMGVTGIVVPVLFNLWGGARFTLPVYAGIALAVLAIVLINQTGENNTPYEQRSRLPILAALGSGMAFGIFFTILSAGAQENSFWIIVISSIVRMPLLLIWWGIDRLRSEPGTVIEKGGWWMAVTAGFLVNAATLIYLMALQHAGNLSLVNTIGSQGTIITVACACLILKERIYKAQGLGLAASASSIALIAYYA